jgi:hypothetical protein
VRHAGALILLLLVAARAQSAPANEECLACHDDPSAARADGSTIAVSSTTYASSVHGELALACVDCHTDLTTVELPHPEQLARADCSSCHDKAVERYHLSVHARRGGQVAGVTATCADCHGAHDILASSNPNSRTYHLNVPDTCGRCHVSGKAIARATTVTSYEDSIHGLALSRRGLIVAPTCVSCHGAHDILARSEPGSRVHRTSVVDTCTTCHAGIRPEFERGVHARALKENHALAPNCASCHTAHAVAATESDEWRLSVISECGTCHRESLGTYRDTFHGKVTALGFTRVATCADCHGAHGILPASDPRSTISPSRRLSTCQKCHADATEKFARYDPHADANDPRRSPSLYYATKSMKVLLGMVFTFFGLHTLLWFPRSLQARRSRNRLGESSPADQEPE